MTKFIRFIEEPIELAGELVLDNPRSKEEVAYWSEYIKHSLSNSHLDSHSLLSLPFEHRDNEYNWPDAIKILLGQLIANGNTSFKEFQVRGMDDIFLLLARMLVIIRYNDHGLNDYSVENLDEVMEQFHDEPESQLVNEYLKLLNKDEEEYKKIISASSLITFLNPDLFGGENFLLNTQSYQPPLDFKIDNSLNVNLLWWARFIYNSKKFGREYYKLSNDLNFEEKLKKAFKIFNSIQEDPIIEFSAESLYVYDKSHSRPGLLAIVSLIEALIIRKPDPNRYHIDDSIMKQFVLKLGVLILDADKNSDMESEKLRLKELYTQRSNIAHGNFVQFSKLIAKTKLEVDVEYMAPNPKDWSQEDYTSELAQYAKKVLRVVLSAYISDPNRVNFIKNN